MGNNHLTYFKIENFKKFESLEVNDIGQFNLIVGDNNVGKTCLLEALLFDEDPSQLVSNFHLGLRKRGLIFEKKKVTTEVNGKSISEIIVPTHNYYVRNFIADLEKNLILEYHTISRNKTLEISFLRNEEVFNALDDLSVENLLKIQNDLKSNTAKKNANDFNPNFLKILANEKRIFANIYDYNADILNFPLISFNDTPLEEETIKIYETLKTEQEIETLTNSLKIVNNKIKRIDFRANFNDLKSVFLFSIDGENELTPLNFMGDGFKRIFYIVLKMLSLKGKRIMIDEIEIGIHHSKMKDFWIDIMKVCNELDVQLFATTHSHECSLAYIEASKCLTENNSINENSFKLIELYNKQNNTTSFVTSGIDNIDYAIKNEPYRGENDYDV